MKKTLLFLITLIFCWCTAFAETRGIRKVEIMTKTGEKIGLYDESHALIIGVSDYTNGWQDLESVSDDVKQVSKALEKQNFNVIRVVNPTKKELTSAFTDFINNYGYNISDEHVLIAGNSITYILYVWGESFPVMIANNYIHHLIFSRWNFNSEVTNYVRNNNFTDGCDIAFMVNPPAYNIDFSSNVFEGNYGFLYNGCCNSGYYDWGEGYSCCSYQYYDASTSNWPQSNKPGFFNWTYNGIDLPSSNPSGGDPLQFTEVVGSTDVIDSGNPNHEYYDIDLTVNDRGVNGGMYSLSNLEPSINLSNGKAFIFDLIMPTDLFQDQNVDVKAKGYHKN